MTEYVYLWRNKFLTVDAESFDDVINMLQEAVDTLREMKATGKVDIGDRDGIVDDYLELVTTDKTVARKFGFSKNQ